MSTTPISRTLSHILIQLTNILYYAPKHMYLAECTGYYSIWYSNSGYIISWFQCACYDVTPLNLQRKCNGCVTSFDVLHSLSYSKGGLLIARHNIVCDKLLYLAWRDLPLASVCVEPFIYQGQIKSEGDICQGSGRIKNSLTQRRKIPVKKIQPGPPEYRDVREL